MQRQIIQTNRLHFHLFCILVQHAFGTKTIQSQEKRGCTVEQKGIIVASEENEGKEFPAYKAILEAVNMAFRDELSPKEQVIFSTR